MANINAAWDKQEKVVEGSYDSRLIDSVQLQQLQDEFCLANNIYLACLCREEGVITKAYGSGEELAYIHGLVDKTDYMNLVRQMNMESVEDLREMPLDIPYVKMCGISVKLEGKTVINWIVVAFLSEQLGEQENVPDCVMKTTEEQFYRSVEFLSVVSRQIFDVRKNQIAAEDAMTESKIAAENLRRNLERSKATTDIVRMLESDGGFDKQVEFVLEKTCASLGLAGGCLIRGNADGKTVDMISEYEKEEQYMVSSRFREVPVEEVPFFDGKPYMISSDSMKPKAFVDFFTKYHVSAMLCQPLAANERDLMYLCFYEHGDEREWQSEDVNFINDIRHVVQGILSKRIARNSLASSYASLVAILENTGCGIYVADYQSRSILYTNQKFQELFVRSFAAGKIEEMVFSEQEVTKKHYYREIYAAEEERWLDAHKTQIQWVDGRTVSLCTLYDITDKKLYQKEIENQANNDFLTGLFNRMRCEQDMERYIARAQAVGGEGALLYLDLDDFKHINDGLGHQYGDVLLKAISHSLQHIDGVENSCYRMGGDEFIIIVPDTIYQELPRILENVEAIFNQPWFLKGEDYYCTMSMGVVCFPTDGETVEDLIRKADMAVFAAKKRGKNRIEYYNAKDEMSAYRRLDLEKNMRAAAMNSCREFEVYYQPIIDVTADGMPCCGAEALVRWNSSVMGFIRPDDFIPLAEYLGLINPIGEHVLKSAAMRCKYWNDMGHPDYKVNVNLSVVQLLQNDIVKKVRNVLEETRINPKNLTLEVTESLAINDMDRMKHILSEIKSLGVKVALDDFGTGYSSLNHIREMPLDVIKIDRCFIEHLGEDDFSDAFVKMVSELASTIGVCVCVEGVETVQQLDIVSHMNIGMIQGYYFGKPMGIGDFEAQYL